MVEGAALRPDLQYGQLRSEGGKGHDTFTYPHFQKDYSYGVNDVLSISQRLLWQARTSHGCIKPGWLLISKLLNPQLGGRDALGLITVYPRPDEH